MFQRIRRRDIILLLGLMSLAAVAVIVVALLILRDIGRQEKVRELPEAAPKPTHTIPNQMVTGLNQYNQMAKPAALAWSSDAELIAASAKWHQLLSLSQVGEPTLWTYHFYSPSKKLKLFVSVEADGQTQIFVHPLEVPLPPHPVATEGWLMDSSVALATWLDHGGSEVLQNNLGLDLIIQLRSTKKLAGPVWIVVGINEQTNTTHMVVVDATKGWVIQ